MTYPTFGEFQHSVEGGNRLARLLSAAIARLSTVGEFTSYMPEEVYAELVKLAGEVYSDETKIVGGTTRG